VLQGQTSLLLNYTNPMSILMETLYTAYPETKSVGLCHSVPYTAREIASYIGVDREDLLYECAVINHIAWMVLVDGTGLRPCHVGDFLPESIHTSGAETRRSHYTSPS